MKKVSIFIAIFLFIISINVSSQCPESFHDFKALDINGDTLDLSSFSGKKVLVVNTASFCMYTPQYEDLQSLYDTYGGDANGYNFEIIGFPANNFMNQEPYDEDSIKDVCADYGVTFQMMSKVSVKGADQHEIYAWLTQQSRNCEEDAPVSWNFQKFMIDENGNWVDFAPPSTSPQSTQITNWIISSSASINDNSSNNIDFLTVNNISENNITITLNCESVSYTDVCLYDILGKRIFELSNQTINNTKTIQINTLNIKSGIYIIEVKQKGYIQRKKILVN